MARPERIISGGQTGADRAALDAAVALGIATGGTAPKGFRICLPDGSDGSDPSLAGFGLVEHESSDYPPRTIQNVADSDGTVWFGYEHSGGGKLTINTCIRLKKHYLVNPSPELLRDWVGDYSIKVLNIAGNRQSDLNPDISTTTYETLMLAFGESE